MFLSSSNASTTLFTSSSCVARAAAALCFGALVSVGGMSSALAQNPPTQPSLVASERGEYSLDPRKLDTPTTQPQKTEYEYKWYGGQTLLMDGSAVALAMLAGSGSSGKGGLAPVAGLLSFAAYGFGAPIVHFVHGNTGKGFGSMGLRFGLPLALGVGGALVYQSQTSHSEGDMAGMGAAMAALVGVGVGMVTASIVDASALAWDSVPKKTSTFSMMPTVAVNKGEMSFGFAGTL